MPALLEIHMPSFCAICEVPITAANDTAEHVIPQSIGGRRTVSGFICRSCNSEAGSTWDSELFHQHHWFTVMLGIKRQRGPAPDIRIEALEGVTYAVSSAGAMTHAAPLVKRSEDGKSFQIRARDLDEAKQLVRQIHKRHPTFDVADVLSGIEFSSAPADTVMKTSFGFGGDLAGRSMVKTVMALAYSLGLPPASCDLALRYLRGDPSVEPSLAEHLVSDLIVDRPARIFNCVSVLGDSRTRRLVGYVEYFGICRWVIHLSTSYDGPDVRDTYCLDAISGEGMDLDVNLALSNEEFQASMDNLTSDEQQRAATFHAIMPLVMARRTELGREALVDHAITAATTAMGLSAGSPLDDFQLKEFSGRVARYLAENLVFRGRGNAPWNQKIPG